ncbi:MAG: hypothetical protein ACJARC_000160 [Sulfitobacter sp.]
MFIFATAAMLKHISAEQYAALTRNVIGQNQMVAGVMRPVAF